VLKSLTRNSTAGVEVSGSEFVFIIGAARSGTKFLREILGESAGVRIVPFDVNYVWRRGNSEYSHDVLPASFATPDIRRYVYCTLHGMAEPKGLHDAFIVEKTVSNTLRVPFLDALFPKARYVHLIRDGRDVAESAARMWEAKPDYQYLIRKLRYFPISNLRYAVWYLRGILGRIVTKKSGAMIWGPRYPGIETDVVQLSTLEVATRQWVHSVDMARAGLESIPKSRKMVICYEDLVQHEEVLDSLANFLGISDIEYLREAYHRAVRRDTGGKWRYLNQEEQRLMLNIAEPTLRTLGYL
jgi:hypothetical protein